MTIENKMISFYKSQISDLDIQIEYYEKWSKKNNHEPRALKSLYHQKSIVESRIKEIEDFESSKADTVMFDFFLNLEQL